MGTPTAGRQFRIPWRRAAFWLAAVLVLGSIVLLVVRQPAELVDVARVHRGEIHEYISERAETRLPEVYRITMPLAGRVEPITLREGDAVSQGQIVARLDPSDLDTDLAAASGRVRQFDQLLISTQHAIEAAKEQVAASLRKATYAESEYKRKRALAEEGVVTESELEEAALLQFTSRVEHTQAVLTHQALLAVEAALRIGRQEAADERDRRQRDRNRAEIASPVDGVVLARLVTNRRALPAGEPLLEIGRLEDLQVVAEVLSQQAVRIEPEDQVLIEGEAIGNEPVAGVVDRIEPRAFTKVSSLGVEQQRLRVWIRFTPEALEELIRRGRRLQVGYRLRVRILTASRSNVLIVPRSALFRAADGRWQAFVVRGGRARLVDIETGLQNERELEVVSGVEEGDLVILAPAASLKDGQRVEPTLVDLP